MASSSLSRTWTYRVFTSFHGPDARKTLLSHLRKQFNYNGITMFDDQGIERSQTIASSLIQAIRQSRISIVVLSKNYASSSWCLDELVEILKCRENIGQIVMTVFYGVHPSDVRKQTGEFGIAFNETCVRKTEVEKRIWSQALNDVGNIAGEDFLNWDNESKMVEKIAKDVSNKLNTPKSMDFEDMVGLEAHLKEMQSLLHLDFEDRAMIVGICGPAGIGKTTISRALHSRLTSSFQFTCFMENLKGRSNRGFDDYGLKLCLQEQLLSKILNQNTMRLCHLGAVQEWLCDLKVLIVLDDVDHLMQLEALANETKWFGPGSRIIVVTENQEILEQHGISSIYHVGFPSREEALEILCRYAFRQSSPDHGFEDLSERIIKLCSNLPLGLRVMGSALSRKNEEEWEDILHRLENSIDRDIEQVLRVGYDSLHENDQSLFLHIALFFNYQDDDHVMTMLSESNLEIRLGLKTLAYRSLIHISTEGEVVMHKLLQQVGRQAIQRQEPWKRQILFDPDEICDVLENDSGSTKVMGISFDISKIRDSVYISARALKKMRNLRFLRVFKTKVEKNDRVHVPDNMDFPPRLRLLRWDDYPRKYLPPTFSLKYLVELDLRDNQLEKLWQGTQPLANLKKMILISSCNLKKLPDLSNARKLEYLDLSYCENLIEIPSSVGKLHKLVWLRMGYCLKLQSVPTNFNLKSLAAVEMLGCSQFRKLPDISRNITVLAVGDTMLEEMPKSDSLWPRLRVLFIYGRAYALPGVPEKFLNRGGADIEKIPDWIKDFHGLDTLCVAGCPKLTSLPELPRSLIYLVVNTCDSLETLPSFPSLIHTTYFPNCFRLGREAQRIVTERPSDAYLPGRNIPAEFDNRAIGNSLTIHSSFCKFRICVLISPTQAHQLEDSGFKLLARISLNGRRIEDIVEHPPNILTDHLFIFFYELLDKDGWFEEDNEISFDFSIISQNIDIIQCGVLIVTNEMLERMKERYLSGLEQVEVENHASKHASCFDLSHIVRKFRNMGR